MSQAVHAGRRCPRKPAQSWHHGWHHTLACEVLLCGAREAGTMARPVVTRCGWCDTTQVTSPHGDDSGPWHGDLAMAATPLADLLKLPANDRAELAMALWESLTETEREAEFELTPTQEAEFARRLAEHDADPSSAIPWDEVRRKLKGGA